MSIANDPETWAFGILILLYTLKNSYNYVRSLYRKVRNLTVSVRRSTFCVVRVVGHRDNYLLLERKDAFITDPKRAKFELPGGELREGDTYKSCVRREVMAALGVWNDTVEEVSEFTDTMNDVVWTVRYYCISVPMETITTGAIQLSSRFECFHLLDTPGVHGLLKKDITMNHSSKILRMELTRNDIADIGVESIVSMPTQLRSGSMGAIFGEERVLSEVLPQPETVPTPTAPPPITMKLNV